MKKAIINKTYRQLNSVRLGLDPFKKSELTPGKITVNVKIKDDQSEKDDLKIEGNYNKVNGILSGLSKLYKLGFLQAQDELDYKILSSTEIEVEFKQNADHKTVEQVEQQYTSVFEKKNLKHLHIEPFRPENLKNWTPKAESDIYMIYGVLEDYTDFKYCCGINQTLLSQLGFSYDESTKENHRTKPDSILIDRTTNEYLIGEFKMNSSAFTLNHNKTDVDVLVVWTNDEKDKTSLPKHVVELSLIAKEAAIENLNE